MILAGLGTGTVFDAEVSLEAADIEPFVTWGTNPGQGVPLSRRPAPDFTIERTCGRRARPQYMDLKAGTPMRDIAVNTVHRQLPTAASKTCAAAGIFKGRRVRACASWCAAPPACAAGRGRGLIKILTSAPNGTTSVLHVPGHEPRRWRPFGLHLQPLRPPELRQPYTWCLPLVAAAHCAWHHPPGRPLRPALRNPTAGEGPDPPRKKDSTTHGKVHHPHRHRRPAAPLNVDTDHIIPAVYLKRVTRTGFEPSSRPGVATGVRRTPTRQLRPDQGPDRRRLLARHR